MEINEFKSTDIIYLSITLEDEVSQICTIDIKGIPKWAVEEDTHLLMIRRVLNKAGEGIDTYILLSCSKDHKNAEFLCKHCGNIIKAHITYMNVEEFVDYELKKLVKVESLEQILKERGINLN